MGPGDRQQREADGRALGAPDVTTRYRLRERTGTYGDDHWIESASGQRLFRVDARALDADHALDLEDVRGTHLCRIRTGLLRTQDTMTVERPDGARVATIRRALVSPLQARWKVHVEDGHELAVQGNIVDHEYTIEEDRRPVAEVSTRWSRTRDTIGVKLAAGVDGSLMLAVVVALDVLELEVNRADRADDGHEHRPEVGEDVRADR